MARYLFASELGGGWGHVMRIRPLALTLIEQDMTWSSRPPIQPGILPPWKARRRG